MCLRLESFSPLSLSKDGKVMLKYGKMKTQRPGRTSISYSGGGGRSGAWPCTGLGHPLTRVFSAPLHRWQGHLQVASPLPASLPITVGPFLLMSGAFYFPDFQLFPSIEHFLLWSRLSNIFTTFSSSRQRHILESL